MKKKTLGAIVACMVIVSAVGSGLFAGFLGNAPPNMEPVDAKLRLTDCSAQKNRDSLNVYLKITNNAEEAIPVSELKINGIAQNSLPKLTLCLNGSSADSKATPLFTLGDSETVDVELVVPKESLGSSFDSAAARVDVVTSDGYYYVEPTVT